ncbi:MAG: FHA domain-containing protein [Acidobacteria bacterium]|nr:FHA domain-containing protein [Acidobacteriota bacterium]
MIKLIVKAKDHDEEKEYNFDQNIIKFGRFKTNDLVLPGANISRQHCTITREEGEFHITDTSSNGTLLNKKLIGRGNHLPLRSGDMIELGDFIVEFQLFVPTEEFEKTTDYLQKRFEELMAGSTTEPEYPTLLIMGGPTANTRLELIDEMEEILLGRTPDCPVQIPSPTVSKHHARIIRRGTIIELEDLHSANGTFVNNVPVTGTYRLKDRDEIVLGQRGEGDPIRIIFSFPSAAMEKAAEEIAEAPATVPMSEEEVAARIAEEKKAHEETGGAVAEAAVAPPPEPAPTPSEPKPGPAPKAQSTEEPPPPATLPGGPPEEIKTGWGIMEYIIFGAVGLAVLVVIVLLILFMM